jgi:hypothetical protein
VNDMRPGTIVQTDTWLADNGLVTVVLLEKIYSKVMSPVWKCLVTGGPTKGTHEKLYDQGALTNGFWRVVE